MEILEQIITMPRIGDKARTTIIYIGTDLKFQAHIVPTGFKHNAINTNAHQDLKLNTIYDVPQHKDGIVRKSCSFRRVQISYRFKWLLLDN